MKHAYDELYAGDVIIQQGGLFEYVVRIHPNVDFVLFVKEYMQSDLRSDIDVGWPKASALLVRELYNRYTLKEGHSIPVGDAECLKMPRGGLAGSMPTISGIGILRASTL